jgi:hypothetical protein
VTAHATDDAHRPGRVESHHAAAAEAGGLHRQPLLRTPPLRRRRINDQR